MRMAVWRDQNAQFVRVGRQDRIARASLEGSSTLGICLRTGRCTRPQSGGFELRRSTGITGPVTGQLLPIVRVAR
jgi:hypothetical protein